MHALKLIVTLGEKGRTVTATEAVVLICDLILGPGESKSCEVKHLHC